MDAELVAIFTAIQALRENDDKGYINRSQEIDFLSFAIKHSSISNSQLLQDIWVLFETNQKRNGYFVEFGVCDGSTLSNTLLLEKAFGWDGAVAEPARIWHGALFHNRECYITDKCVSSESGQTLAFHEAEIQELSGAKQWASADFQSLYRQGGNHYDVETISLSDFLKEAKAPQSIDYLSIDIEGGEKDVIASFDFSSYDINLITVEHNFSPQRQEIYNILRKFGYRRKFVSFSMFDDWYFKP